MKIQILAALLIAIGVFSETSAQAETHVVSVSDPGELLVEYAKLVPINIGAELNGITGVSVRVVGVGGGGTLDCVGSSYDGWHGLEIDVMVGGSHNVVSAGNQVSFDQVGLQSFFEIDPWEYMEGTPSYGIGIAVRPVGVPAEVFCSPESVLLPQVSLIELTIESETVVSTDSQSWGTLKGRYY